MDAPGGGEEGTDARLYRGILEDMVRGLPRELRTGGVRRLVEIVRNIYRQADVDPPEWLDRVLPPGEREG